MPRPIRLLPLALVLVGCAHGSTPRLAAAPAPAPTPTPSAASAPAPAAAGDPPVTAQVITFDGDEAAPEPTTPIRSAPRRPPIPAFQLFGTRPGDGP